MKLYKYRPFGKYTDQIFTHNSIYFSNSTKLNDPYEMKLPLDRRELSVLVHFRLTELYQAGEISEEEGINIGYYFPVYKDEETERKRGLAKNKVEMLMKSTGILSMSEINDSILMWSHYADSHKGICIEFEDLEINCLASRQPELFKVKYSDKFYDMNSPDVYINSLLELFRSGGFAQDKVFNLLDELTRIKAEAGAFDSLTAKAKDWEYEQEWRLLYIGHNGTVLFNPFCITSVTFGSGVQEDTVERYIEFVKYESGKPHIKFKRARQDSLNFKIGILDI